MNSIHQKKTQHSIYWILAAAILVLLLASCGGNDNNERTASNNFAPPQHTGTGDQERGKELFDVTCFACHGPDGTGIEGLGKDMTTSEFIRNNSERELLTFLKTGRSASDPANTTGVDMPAKGGNNTLNDDDLKDIIAYMRTLQE